MTLITEEQRVTESPHRAPSEPPTSKPRRFLPWVAVIAGLSAAALLLVAVITAGGSDGTDRTLVERAAGSDRHLELRAQEIEREVAEAATQNRSFPPGYGSDRHLELRAREADQRAEQPATQNRTFPPGYGSDRHLELRAQEAGG